MRIVSKFHDYYDSCLKFGQDDNVVYIRDTLEFDPNNRKSIPEPFKSLLDALEKLIKRRQVYSMFSSRHDMLHNSKKAGMVEINSFLVVFCGKIYKGYRVGSSQGVKHVYSLGGLAMHLESLECDVNKATGKYSRHSYVNVARDWFNDQVYEGELENLVADKISIAYFCPSQRNFVINPSLKDIEFYKVFPPYEAYQELDMWISGTLAYPHNPVIELSEKDRVQQHGFDPKYGFRTRPKG